MRQFFGFGLAVSLYLLLQSCVPTGEGDWRPIPMDGSGQSAPQPAPVKPTVPPIQPTAIPTIVPTALPIAEDETNIPGMREVHGVVNAEDCAKMEQRFRQQGRNLRLVNIKPRHDTIIKYICIFEGADAGTDTFTDNRSK
jgi:hypothetical protein